MTEPTPFERDIADQPAALRRLATAPPPDLTGLGGSPWDRIVLTGMGSSHFAGLPTWRALVEMGHEAWTVDAGQLLDTPGLLTSRTLLVVTSQSGASGEVVQLLGRRAAQEIAVGLVVGIADDEDSPLARQADVFLPLRSGPESTVSTKSYLNSLAVHRQVLAAFSGEPLEVVAKEMLVAADSVEERLGSADLERVREADLRPGRVAYVGWGDEGATALFAGLITKESSKVPAEGFIGGQFRHGPIELAGSGMTAVLFGVSDAGRDAGLYRVGADLVDTGADVVLVGDGHIPGARTVHAPGRTALEALSTGAVVAQVLAVGLARGNGFTPGAFLYGSKVTTTL